MLCPFSHLCSSENMSPHRSSLWSRWLLILSHCPSVRRYSRITVFFSLRPVSRPVGSKLSLMESGALTALTSSDTEQIPAVTVHILDKTQVLGRFDHLSHSLVSDVTSEQLLRESWNQVTFIHSASPCCRCGLSSVRSRLDQCEGHRCPNKGPSSKMSKMDKRQNLRTSHKAVKFIASPG